MKRRDILKAMAAAPLLASPVFTEAKPVKKHKIIKPKRLKAGDTVAVVAPASGLGAESFDNALKNLESLGLKPKTGKSARGMKGFLAATDQERLDDLHRAFSDPEVSAVWCLRGGYGAARLLPSIDYELIRKHPKILIGYSDITALHLAISQKTGLVTFHGPVAASAPSDYTRNHVTNVLMKPTENYKIALSEDNKAQPSNLYRTEPIVPGRCRGRLVGGNLSLLAALAGTPYALPDLKDKILFIEDVGEQPYRIDRMLTQLRQSANLTALAGVALGVFEDCNPRVKETQSLIDVVRDRLGDLGVPVIYGLSFGHIRDQFTIPVGVEAELDTTAATLTLLEAGTV
ncbi:MAG TPA: LD-carboxypeptidase [Pyrinomonadaceae bacterium]